MKRLLVIVLASLMLMGLVGTAGPASAAQVGRTARAAQMDRVRCQIPSNYRVVCFNYTPYAVRVRLNIFTTSGLFIRWFTMRYTRKVIFSPAYVNRITWRWWWV